jgi:hypothetical protein
MLTFIIWLFYIRLCAKQGAKRVIGGLDGAMLGVFFSLFGVFAIMASRRLDDKKANVALLAEFEQIKHI